MRPEVRWTHNSGAIDLLLKEQVTSAQARCPCARGLACRVLVELQASVPPLPRPALLRRSRPEMGRLAH
jgi:hypothetical protein